MGLRRCSKAVWRLLIKWLPGVLLIATTIMTLGAFLGRLYWRFDVLAHVRPQYFLAAAFLTGWYLIYKRQRLAMLSAAILFINGAVILPHALPDRISYKASQNQDHDQNHAKVHSLRVATINVLLRNDQYDLLEERLKEWQPEIVAIQECGHLWRFAMQKWKALYPYQTLEADGGGHFELVILSKKPWKKLERIQLGAGVYSFALALQYEMEGKRFWVMTLHSPKPTREAQLAEVKRMHEGLARWLEGKRKEGQSVIIMGDFNCTPWSIYYRDLMRHTHLHAASRGKPFMTTWNVWYPFQLMIDHVFFTEDWKLKNTYISRGFGSDHRPVIVDLEWK